jgi:ribosomal protein S18 acetylase RimI-like enzyme
VSAARIEELDAACQILVSHLPPVDRDRVAGRYRELFASGELDPAGLFLARSPRGALRGAILVQVMTGALGLAWPPVAERGRPREATEDALVAAAREWLRSQGVQICQAFAGDLDRESFAPLERSGFKNLTQLVELRCGLRNIPDAGSRLNCEPFAEDNRASFMAVLLASFEGSLDCPEVSGGRTEEELVATYTESIPASALWHLAKWDGRPIGVVLLDPNCEPGVCELTYLGIVPEFRRRGFGSELMRFALQSARNAGCETLVLSVDARNVPARRLYETLGFQVSGARSVFLADWSGIS